MYVLLHVLELYFSQCSDWSLHKRNCRCHRGWCYICIVLFHSFCWCCCRCKCIQRNFFRFSVSRRPHRLPYLLLPVPELPKCQGERNGKWVCSNMPRTGGNLTASGTSHREQRGSQGSRNWISGPPSSQADAERPTKAVGRVRGLVQHHRFTARQTCKLLDGGQWHLSTLSR